MSFKHLLSGACFALALSLSQLALAEAQGGRAEKNLYQVAMELMAEGRYDEMRVVLEELVSTEPEHAGAWLDIAMLYCSMGNAEKAEALFEKQVWTRILESRPQSISVQSSSHAQRVAESLSC